MDPFGLVGTCVADKYQISSVIGQGGYGVVYSAKHLLLGKQVALKCMKPLGTSAEDTKRATALFLREADVLFSMMHPGIVRLYDVGTLTVGLHEEVPYAVLELVEGRSLEQEIDQRAAEGRPFTRQELERIFVGILDALAFTHAAGVAHRDLKPSNVMLVPAADGVTTKVLDFGVARFVARETKRSTGITGFTPAYSAPEQWTEGFGEPGPATDVFAIALTMAEACTLRMVMHAPTPRSPRAATRSERGCSATRASGARSRRSGRRGSSAAPTIATSTTRRCSRRRTRRSSARASAPSRASGEGSRSTCSSTSSRSTATRSAGTP